MIVRWYDRLAVCSTAMLLLALGAAARADRPIDKSPLDLSARPPFHIHRFNTSGPIGLAPSQIRHAYGFDQLTSTGAGQTIAIVDAYGSPTIQKDLNTFCSQFHLPPTMVQIAYPTGKPAQANGGWALETSMDVEWAHAIAPGATILLVVAKTATYGNLLTAVDYAAAHARQVSMSWGSSEFSGETSYDYHFNQPGITFTASSGDNGAGVEWPAASPYVTSVGGTTLYLDSSNNIISESAWSGSGGGISSDEVEPACQSVWQSTGWRTVPDVSYDADPNSGVAVYDSTVYSGHTGWWEVGGTSAGAPQWAALVALANAGRGSSLGLANGTLYSLSKASGYASCFDDVTSGNNGGYAAGAGYDTVTGIGSPLTKALVPDLILSVSLH
jgi:subtilase family serine protease